MFNLFNLIDEANKENETTKNNSVVDNSTTDNQKVCTNVEEVNTSSTSQEEQVSSNINSSTEELSSTETVEDTITTLDDLDISSKEKELEEASQKKVSSDKTTKAAKEEKFEPNEFTIIRYWGQDIPITNYITIEELADGVLNGKGERTPVTAEILRKRMEKEYPELVASHTEMLFLQKKEASYVVPTLKAKKKGAVSLDTSPSFPLIPFEILSQFLELAKVFSVQDLEIHADIYFDTVKKEYYLDVPGQIVHKYYCEVDENSYSILERIGMDSIKIAEIHSHHTMPPLPSIQDNESETVKGMNYIIVGNIDHFFPSITARKYNGLAWNQLKLEELFDKPQYQLPHFNADNITVSKSQKGW